MDYWSPVTLPLLGPYAPQPGFVDILPGLSVPTKTIASFPAVSDGLPETTNLWSFHAPYLIPFPERLPYLRNVTIPQHTLRSRPPWPYCRSDADCASNSEMCGSHGIIESRIRKG